MTTDQTTRYVRRDRLLERLLRSPIGVVEAGAGYGKSVLASQYRRELARATVHVPLGPPDADAQIFAASLRRGVRSARLSDLLSATEVAGTEGWIERLLDALADTREGLLIVLDDAHHLDTAGTAAMVIRLARGLAPHHRLLIAARSLTGALAPIAALEASCRLDTRALAFTPEEVQRLMHSRAGVDVSERRARAMVETTEGWATALVLAAARDPDAGVDGFSQRDGVIAASLRAILRTLGPSDRRLVLQLAHLPSLSPEVCDSVAGAPGAFARIVAAGVPLARIDSGWWEMPSPVASYLAAQEPVAPATVLAAAAIYEREGDPLGAIRVLLGAGLCDEAAARLAAISPAQVEELGLAVVRELVEALPGCAVAGHPRVLLHLARLAEIAHLAGLRSAALARAVQAAAADTNGVLARELAAEQARDLMWDERTRAESRLLASEVIAHAGPDELIARARALDVLGRLGTWFCDGDPRPEAESQLQQSARLARRAGQRTWAAQALIPLAMGVYFANCRYERALAVLSEALADLPARNRYRAMVHTFRAELLIEMARYSDAESSLAEVREIGHVCGEEWIIAYAAWGRANLASYRGDAAGTVDAVLEVERHRDEWYDQPSGVEFLAQAADYLDRVGEHSRAAECLDRARQRMAGSEHHVRVYGAAVLARSGDPRVADAAIVDLLADGTLEAQERWPLILLRASAAQRRADPAAGRLAAEAFDMCLELGHPSGPLIRERVAAASLLPLAATAGSRAALQLLQATSGSSWSLRLLGGFELHRAGRPIQLPSGHAAKSIRIIAVCGGRMHVEELIEQLWPAVDPPTGRRRLRNLLNRVHAAAGELVRRDGEMLILAPEVECDAERFEADARAALAARSAGDPDRAVVHARSAIERYLGDLLPEDRYEPWAAGARERLRLSCLELLDLLAQDSARRGDVDEAIRLIRRAIDAESDDERRYIRLARLLAAQGRVGSALAVLRQARAMLDRLGLDPSPMMVALERSLDAHGG